MNERINLSILQSVATQLGPLLDEVVFIGGAITSFLLTDEAQPEARSTIDIDVIIEIGSHMEYYRLEDQLRMLGFKNATGEDQPLCRWLLDSTPIDVMPTDASILGFSNRWYSDTIQKAKLIRIGEALQIKIASAPHFIATKIEAFKGRGAADFLGSHDLEDIITVLDGRREIVDEILESAEELRAYLKHELDQLYSNPYFLDVLPGHLLPDTASQARIPGLKEKIQNIIKG
ncbi:MAG: hypothetical protein HQ556_16305 [Candidatus Marinimicrobia bacterium]|nr:hypothetical protein [Candidatus Neomarinimicrobiota bacterium]